MPGPQRRPAGKAPHSEDDLLRIIAELDSGAAHVRLAAAIRLRDHPDERAVTSLVRCLSSDDWRLQEAAIEALGACGDHRATQPLLEILRERGDEAVGSLLVRALGDIGDPSAIPALLRALEEGNEATQAEAQVALSRTPGGVEALRAVLHDESPGRQIAALDALAALGDAAEVESVAAGLSDPDARVRRKAAQALGTLGNPGAREHLARALDDPDLEVRAAAALAAGELPDDAAVAILSRALADTHPSVRRGAAIGSGAPASRVRLALIMRAAADPHASVRAAAVRGLGAHAFPGDGDEPGSAPAIAQLRAATADLDPEVRAQAAAALRGSRGAAEAREMLLTLLEDGSERVRGEAVSTIWADRASGFEEALVVALCDPAAVVRVGAVSALHRLAVGEALEPIAALLKDEDWSVRRAALDAVRSLMAGRRSTALVVEALRGLLVDDDQQLSRSAAETLRGLHR